MYRLAQKFAAKIATTTGHILSPQDMVQRLGAHQMLQELVARHALRALR